MVTFVTYETGENPLLYYVQRILKQLGFAVFNLSGGYVSWKACVAESEDLQKYYMKKIWEHLIVPHASCWRS